MGIGKYKHPQLVIFDCDGVLVDTEKMTNAFMAEIISGFGFPITGPECQKRFVGLSLPNVRAKLQDENDFDLGDDFVETIYSGLPSLFEKGVDAIECVEQAIFQIREAGIPYCVASSGKVEKMQMTLGSSGLLPIFEDVLFSGYMVENGKPAPDLFLFAASEMGHSPENCVVIEDSAFGVQAGISAGMRVLAYCGDPTADTAKLADIGGEIFTNMQELPALIGID